MIYRHGPFTQKQKLDNLASEIWKFAERLRGKFKVYEYRNVILPIIVIRRLEYVLMDKPHCSANSARVVREH
jgi:type I restriction-modification system DNA methylase subunit